MKQQKDKLIQRASSDLYASSKADYFEKPISSENSQIRSWPGLTPGLAPVDYESESESE